MAVRRQVALRCDVDMVASHNIEQEKQQEGLLDAPTLPPAITDSNKMDR